MDCVDKIWITAIKCFRRPIVLELLFNFLLCMRAMDIYDKDRTVKSIDEIGWNSDVCKQDRCSTLMSIQDGRKSAMISSLYELGVVFYHACFVLRHCFILPAAHSPTEFDAY